MPDDLKQRPDEDIFEWFDRIRRSGETPEITRMIGEAIEDYTDADDVVISGDVIDFTIQNEKVDVVAEFIMNEPYENVIFTVGFAEFQIDDPDEREQFAEDIEALRLKSVEVDIDGNNVIVSFKPLPVAPYQNSGLVIPIEKHGIERVIEEIYERIIAAYTRKYNEIIREINRL